MSEEETTPSVDPNSAETSNDTTTTWGRLISLAYQRPLVAVALSGIFALTLVLVPVVIAWPKPDCSVCPCPEPACDCMDLAKTSSSCDSRAELLADYIEECRGDETEARDALLQCLAGKIRESIEVDELIGE